MSGEGGDRGPARRLAVFLDRDGVLNRAMVRDGLPYPPESVASLEVVPGVAEACATLRGAGFLLVVVTNQPDIARGTRTREDVEALNRRLAALLPLDDFRVCPHDDRDGCDCRKPSPGLLLAAARDRSIDLRRSVMVGDRWRDIESGRRAGCRTVFVDHGYSERRPERPDLTVSSLGEAVPWILATASQERNTVS
jgi:D-glycero-D-manno-heptose 1,7-bisphosphate phosphatase